MTRQPVLIGLNEVARVTGRSLATVRRALPQLQEYGAEKDDGQWRVPVSAVLGVGWTLHDVGDDVSPTPGDVRRDASRDEVERLREQVIDLERRLVKAEAQADKWQAIAAERNMSLDDLRRTMRVIERRQGETSTSEPVAPAETVAEPAPVSTPAPDAQEPLRGRLARWLSR